VPSIIELLGQGQAPGSHFYLVPLHAAIEAIGAVTALLLSHLLRLSEYQPQRGYVLWARCALISMGTLDLFHSVALPGEDFVWLRSMATLTGGMLFALVWMPERSSRTKIAPVLPWAVLIVSMAIGLASRLFAQILPPMLLTDGFTRTATRLNVLGGGLFLAASVWFFRAYLTHKRRRDDILFALLCLLFGSAGMVFCFSRLWDMEWWLWHILRSSAYVLATFYVFEIIHLPAKKLQISEERYKRLVDNSPDLIYIFSSKRGGIYYSQRVSDYLGYSPEELVNNSFIWHDSIHPEDLPAVDSLIKEFYRGQTYEIEYRMKDRQGNWHWFLDRFIRQSREDDEIIIEGMASDITKRKQAEDAQFSYRSFLESLERVDQAIRQAESLEDMLTAVLDTCSSIFGCDRAWLIYPCDPEAPSWSVRMEKTRPRYPGALAIGKDFPTTPEVREVFLEILNSGSPVVYDPVSGHPLPQVSRQFSVQSQIQTAVYPKMGKPWAFGMHQCSYARIWNEKDVRLFTEVARRIADGLSSLLFLKDLRESERMLREAQGIAELGHYNNDLLAGTWTCSETLERLFGIGPDYEKTVEGWLKLVHPEHLDEIRHYYSDHMLKQGLPFNKEYRIVRANDHAVRWVHGVGRLEYDAAGRPIRMFGTIQDVTAQKKTEEALRRHAETQRTLLLEVNHRVKNNLMVIISMLHMEEDRARETGQGVILPLLHDIQGRIEGLLTVHSMLSSATWKPLKLDLLCEQIARGVIKSSGKEVMLSVSPSDVLIDSDQAHNLTIVLNELATNSLKHAIPAATQPRIDIVVSEVDEMVSLIFRDNGPGFPPNIISGNYTWSGIGIKLIIGIVEKSLRGNIFFGNENGAATHIQFAKTTKTDREGPWSSRKT